MSLSADKPPAPASGLSRPAQKLLSPFHDINPIHSPTAGFRRIPSFCFDEDF
jgi:hypothetical protein